MKVQNHKKYAYFEYVSEPNNQVELGDILFRHIDEPEIGVVIQTCSDGDFRTDMWGMDHDATLATYEEIKKYRPELFDDKAPEYVCGECGWEGDELKTIMVRNEYNKRDKTLYELHVCPECELEI